MARPRVRVLLAGLSAAAIITASIGLTLSAQAPAGPPKAEPAALRYVANRLIVKPRRGATPAALGAAHAALGAQVRRRFAALGDLQVVDLPAAVTVPAAIDRYRRSGLVEYAEPDYIVDLVQQTPNDLSSLLWGLHNTGQNGGTADADIDAPEAWASAFDSSSAIVGIIDTGVDYTHPDLAQNMWRNPGETPGDGLDNDGNGYVDDVYGINAIAGAAQPGNPMDDNNHGTHVAGTIGAVGNNGTGVVGVAWTAKLMALKFLASSGSGSTSDAIACIDYARQHGAKVLNNSWGGGGYSQGLYDAILAARNAGIIFVAAAGNNASDTDGSTYYPQGYALDNVVSVQATTRTDAMSGFSNYGYDSVDLGAPGSDIYSTIPGGGYASFNGTSMATPHVAGALALLRAFRPDLTTHGALINQLLGTVDRIPGLAGTTRTGGRLNLARALTGTPKPTSHLQASPRAGAPGLTVTFTDESFGPIASRSLDFGDGSPASPTADVTHTYASAGTYTARLTVTASDGTTHASTRSIVVQQNYDVAPAAYAWIDTTGFTGLSLTDDSASAAITLPFTFSLYGRAYTTAYISSNGFVTLGGNAGATSYANGTLPSAGSPNAALYAYWDDLDPGVAGAVRYGVSGGSFVVSWEGVPIYNNPAVPLTFQLVLEPSGAVRMQYFEVQPASALGAGRSATVGIEDASGAMARVHSHNGSPLLANGTAIRFSLASAPAAPAAPTGLVAGAVSASAIGLTWVDQATDETGYRVERWNGTGFTTVATLGANATSHQDSGLQALTQYTYRVLATNAAGASAPSNEASATTLAPPAPSAPTSLAGSAVGSTSVSLTWNDTSSNEDGFTLERAGDAAFSTGVVAFTLGAGVRAYTDTPGALGTFHYRVRAFNAGGPSAWSAPVSVVLTNLPGAPSSLAASAIGGRQIRVTFVDNATNETSFQLQEATNSAFTAGLKTITVPAAAGTGTTVTQVLSNRTAGKTFYYRSRSVNSAGSSAWSNTASATSRK